MARLIITTALALLMSGCTIAQTANLAVSRYCAKPEEARDVVRNAIGLAVAPNRIEVACYVP